jgi:succinyl-diaminopimelate desuccinylase
MSGVMDERALLRLMLDVLSIDTQNPPGHEKALAEYIKRYLRNVPCEVRVQDLDAGRANVIAVRKGRTRGNALLLNGHLDTVPYGNVQSWHTPPDIPVVEDGRIRARGASDMKSGLCAALYAFKALCVSGEMPVHDVLFAGTADEETGGTGAQALLDGGFLDSVQNIIIGEPTGNALGLCAKGTLWLRCTLRGRTSHAAYPDRGINVIDHAIALSKAIARCAQGHPHPLLGKSTSTVTQMEAGVKINVVPDVCVMALDIRTTPDLAHAPLMDAIRAQVAAMTDEIDGLSIAVDVLNDRMPVSAAPDCNIARALSASYSAVCGEPIRQVGAAFFSDASVFLREKRIDTILFGPGESNEAHRPNESVDLHAVAQAARVYLHLLTQTVT